MSSRRRGRTYLTGARCRRCRRSAKERQAARQRLNNGERWALWVQERRHDRRLSEAEEIACLEQAYESGIAERCAIKE